SLTYTYIDNVDSELEELEKYFKNNLKMEESLKQLQLGQPSPMLQNLFDKCQIIKRKLNQLKVPTDTIHDDISNIEHIISEQSKIKVLYNRLNSDIHTKKSYLNKLYNDLSL